jgi:hypothetical protein
MHVSNRHFESVCLVADRSDEVIVVADSPLPSFETIYMSKLCISANVYSSMFRLSIKLDGSLDK